MNVLWLNKDDVEGLLDMKGALEVVAGIKPERTDDGEITIFDSAWLATQDISAANHVYRKTIDAEVRRYLKLF